MPRAESKPRKRYIDDLYRVRGPTVRAMLDGSRVSSLFV